MPDKKNNGIFKHLLILTFLLLQAFTAHGENILRESEPLPPLDSVVIMDSSGSMKQSDPRQLRKPAAKLFISLLDQQDKLSVVSFSSRAWPITFLTQLDSQQNIDKALNATDKISHKGVYTNIHSALEKGIEFLKESQPQGRDPIIILMSDGKIDVGNTDKSAELRKKIISDLIPQLKEHNIKVYSIAFTEESDQALMQEIAEETEGRYALAASDDVLHKVFSKIFEQAKEPNMLPLHENMFVVDASIKELTIIANKKSDQSQIHLQKPNGDRINSSFKSETLKWFVSSSFDMITITKPEEGEWKILFSDDDNKAYIVTDIKLRTRFEFNQESYNPELIIRTWFEQNEVTEANQELLNNMQLQLEIEHPDGRVDTFPIEKRDDSGTYTVNYSPEMNGFYGASIVATSQTFQRQQTFSFSNTMPVAPEPEPEPEPVTEIESSTEVAQQEEVPAEENTESDDLKTTLIYFAVINLILLFIGINAVLIFKYIRSK